MTPATSTIPPRSQGRIFSDPEREPYYLFPIRRNPEAIARLDLYNYNDALKTYDAVMYVRKRDKRCSSWFYPFREPGRATSEETNHLDRIRRLKKDLNPDELVGVMKQAGTIICRSDVEMDAEEAYDTYRHL